MFCSLTATIPFRPISTMRAVVCRFPLCDQLERQRRRLLEAVLAEALMEPENMLEVAYA